jgi:uncharacterized tellurite resistance protein B-like protein
MLNIIKKVLGKNDDKEQGEESQTLHADAALCILLLEAAHADGQCSEEERQHLIATLVKQGSTPEQEIEELIAQAYKQRDDSVDIFQFTRYMNNSFTKEEKIEVMQSVWRIIHADGHLEPYEDQFAHKLANLLRLSHAEMIECKIQARK